MSELVIDIRGARISDATDLANVHAAAWKDAYQGIIPAITLQKMINRRGARWWAAAARRRRIIVLDVGGKVAGYVSFGLARMTGRADTGEIQEIYLLPEYQGIGLGGRLFRAACNALRAEKFDKLVIRALSENEKAMCFYQRQGGNIVATSHEVLSGTSIPSTVFEWRLLPPKP